MVYFDIDGVLRNLCFEAGIRPFNWNCKIDGLPFVKYFSNNLYHLYFAPKTEYFDVAVLYNTWIAPFKLMSTQPDSWIPNTKKWVKENFNPYMITPEIIFTDNKLSQLKQNDILIEDNPTLTNYNQVILVDRSYNRNLQLSHTRVYTPRQLFLEILRRHHGAEV